MNCAARKCEFLMPAVQVRPADRRRGNYRRNEYGERTAQRIKAALSAIAT